MIDIGNADGVSEAVGEANGIEGGITGLPHCAGVLQRLLAPGKLELREWDLVNSIDLRGAYLVHAWGRCDHSTRLVAGMRSAPLHAHGPQKRPSYIWRLAWRRNGGRANVRVNAASTGFTKRRR